jgi:pyruvate,water dikinase
VLIDVPFESTSCDPVAVGGKAEGLIELRRAGFLVPEFVVSPFDVTQAVRQLGTPLVVRSSVSLEDGVHASFAGQFGSFLNLRTVQDVHDAIEQCRSSLDSASVRDYCRRIGKSQNELQMHIILQRMIQPELAGVAFSVNPMTGDEKVVIEACDGVAMDLLAGRRAPLPVHHPRVARYRDRIEQLVLDVQAYFGAPQDVEFAIEEGKVYVLQSRPITRIEFADEPGEWTNADFRDGGVSSRVCTPLMASLYEHIWDRALKMTLRQLHLFERDFPASRQFFGRLYWNVGEVKRCVARLPGFREREFDQDVNIRITYEGDGQCTPFSLRGLIRAVPTIIAMRQFLSYQERSARLLLIHADTEAPASSEPPALSAEERFRALVEREYLDVETTYFRTIFAVSLAKMDLLSSFPEADDRSLIAALPPLRHLAPIREVRALKQRTPDQLRAIVRQYRHHCRLGLDICLPRWDEDEEFVVPLLQDLPDVEQRDPRHAYARAHVAVLSKLTRWKRRRFELKLRRLRNLVWLREELRDISNRYYYCLRRAVLEIARARSLDDDIFMMTFQQILADDRRSIERNRQRYQGYRHFQPPNEIGRRYRYQPGQQTKTLWNGSSMTSPLVRLVAEERRGEETGNAKVLREPFLRGVGASGGRACGRVFVAANVHDAAAMPAGQVLVCPFTDPGWTPVLERALAVVTETGGLLSHAAVICREFGIPAVLGVDRVTHRVRTGQEVVVWGDRGLVEATPNSVHEET